MNSKSLVKKLGLVGITLLLAGCAIGTESSEEKQSSVESSPESSVQETTLPEFKEGNLIFSEFYVGKSSADRAIEVSNIGDNPIDLGGYSIIIYKSGLLTDPYEMKLSGTLAPKSSHVIAYSGAGEELKAKANQFDELLPNIGMYPMVVTDGKYVYDTIGVPGYKTEWGTSIDLVRKNEFMKGTGKFEPFDWIGFDNSNCDRLGQFECPLSLEELNEGPRIPSEYIDAPFFQEGSTTLGGGGFADVTVSSYGDGDTTRFNYPNFVNDAGYGDGTSCRYQNIDTPETQHGTSINAQPWGYAAGDFTNDILRSSKRIKVQSLPGVSITETFGRLLLYVWASNETSGYDSFFLVNHKIVQAGFSKVQFSGDTSSKMLYKGISYYQYLIDAQHKAEKEGLKIHGEKDPNFNY